MYLYIYHSEAGLYTTVLDCGGETHFDPYHTNPLKYASVLLACHRFGDAVLYLWNSNKPLPAIHIMLLCLYYGLILPCVPLTQNPPFRHASLLTSHVGSGGGGTSGSGNSQLSPANILLYYFNEHIQQTIPEICLDYIMYLQPVHWNTNTPQRELSYDTYNNNIYNNILTNNDKLIISIIQKFLIILPKNMLTRIVGVPITPVTTTLNIGYIYQYFDRVTINRYLHHIAYHLLTEKQEIEAAIYFYQLCGMYIDAMDIISKQLCKVITSKLTSEREHWINIATNFYETYIHNDNGLFLLSTEKNSLSNLTSNPTSNPPSDVTTLTSTPSDQLNTFLTLLNISLLVTHVYKQEYTDAYTVLNEINILPPTSKDVNKYIQTLHTIPPLTTTTTTTTTSSSSYILYLIDDLLLISMDVYINMIALLQQQASAVMCSNIQRNEIKYQVCNVIWCNTYSVYRLVCLYIVY